VKLITTTDKAELMFQQAETARDEARDDAAREKAADLYREDSQTPRGISCGPSWAGKVVDGLESARESTFCY
jgi:hypothetical protein